MTRSVAHYFPLPANQGRISTLCGLSVSFAELDLDVAEIMARPMALEEAIGWLAELPRCPDCQFLSEEL